ncbi:hypothetical protein MtrunA17_Chr3g0115231 [Medicago truncatula]|uniref:Uncharacterized protein n=1 Tax=Medicago truncatula TaxID=3880 RepID=I3S174_MEDTR|nr:unknown [Medicago truncatula]RHN68561.1 hypothetical protein MtrunA17_Chr3g0115231 [Medicago truncatula]
MQPIFGDKGSLQEEDGLILHLGRFTSLMEGLEHNIGRNVFL